METLKRVSYIFICVFAIFLMSHNASAATLSVPVHMQATFDNPKVQCNTQSGWTDQCATSATPIYFIKMATYNLDNFQIPTGNYYVEIILRSEGNLSSASTSSFITSDIPSSTTISPIEIEQLSGSSSGAFQYYNYRVLGKYTGSATPPVIELGVTWNTTPWLWGGATGVDHITFWRIDDDNAGTQDIVNAINDAAGNITDTESQATQDAADNASDAGSSSAASAESATSSLISVIGGFVSVITSAQPTNCVINADMNHINMGNLDLCANPAPSYVQIIGSIILICAAIPLAIVLFNRFIGLFRSFQN